MRSTFRLTWLRGWFCLWCHDWWRFRPLSGHGGWGFVCGTLVGRDADEMPTNVLLLLISSVEAWLPDMAYWFNVSWDRIITHKIKFNVWLNLTWRQVTVWSLSDQNESKSILIFLTWELDISLGCICYGPFIGKLKALLRSCPIRSLGRDSRHDLDRIWVKAIRTNLWAIYLLDLRNFEDVVLGVFNMTNFIQWSAFAWFWL